jgi:hypothetical protein
MSKLHILSAAAAVTTLWMGGVSQAAVPAAPVAAADATIEVAQAIPTVAGLTVTGTGVATAPADRAIVFLSYYSNYYSQPSEDPNVPPPPPPTPTAADIKPVVDAITAAGGTGVETSVDPSSSGSFRVRTTVDKPTQAKMQALIAAANAAAIKTNKFSTGGAQIGYLTSNCQALETESRRLAMADARSRSSAMASSAGVQVGSLVSLAEIASWGYYGGSACPSTTDPLIGQDPYTFPGVDLLSPAVVRVNSTVTATYEMK